MRIRCVVCGRFLAKSCPSEWFCSAYCQTTWHERQAYLPEDCVGDDDEDDEDDEDDL